MEQFQAVVENRTGFCLDPRTKLLLMAVVATAEFLYSHTAFMIAVAMIPFVLLLTNRQYKTATVFFCLFAAGLFVQAIQNSVQFPMIVNMLVVLLVGLVLRLFPAFVMGAYIIKSTTASECITALGRMHIGRQITIPLSVLFRFIPTMQEESAAIKDAMRMREVQFGTKKFWQNPAALIEYRFIPLMISVVKIGDDLSAAALTRGLDNPVRRTNITKVGFTGWDLLAVLIAGAALLSTASVSGYIKTPKLTGIGEGTADITVTCHTAPYFEPYHSWGQDHEQHYIQVEGPGTITDGGPTKAEPTGAATANTDKQVTVQCTTHVDSDKIPTTDYVNPTEHVVKIAGATKETRIVIAAHPYGTKHYRLWIDDIQVTKDR